MDHGDKVCAVNDFYAALHQIYLQKFTSAFSNAEAVSESKRFWADKILTYTPDELAYVIRTVRDSEDDRLSWPDIRYILTLPRSPAEARPDRRMIL